MKKAIYKQIDTEIIERIIPREDEEGNLVEDSLCEIERIEKPVMGMVFEEETEEEQAERIRRESEIPEPTAEERIAELENQNAMLLECVLEMSEIIYA